MKKNEKYYPVNSQEDEDGYTLHPGNAIIDENAKSNQDISSLENTGSTEPGSAKLQLPGYILSPSPMPGK
jgi:hypothetical protein